MGYKSVFEDGGIFKEIDNSDEKSLYMNVKIDTSINQTLVKNERNSTNGFYYLYDGTFLGNYGDSKEVVVCSKKVNKEDKKTKKKWQEYLMPVRLTIENEELIHFAASIYGESSIGFGVVIENEVYAFASTIGNFKRDKYPNLTYRQALEKNGVYAVGSTNYTNFKNEKDRNSKPNMKLAIQAVIKELKGGEFDYSYGAYYWDGIDIKTGKWAEGLKFSSDDHDIFGIKDNKKEGKEFWKDKRKKDTKYLRRKWEYAYITTIAYSGENSKKKNEHFPYFKGDNQNRNRFGTTFMKDHPDFKKIIPNQTQTDDE